MLAAFGCPMLPLAFVDVSLLVFVPTLYARDLGLGLAATGFALMLARGGDLLGQPLVGALADRLRLPFGRRRPWLALGLPVVLLGSYRVLLPAPGAGMAYLLAWSLVLYFGLAAMALPHRAWGAELSGGYHERTRISGYRETFVLAGTLLAALVPAAQAGLPAGWRIGGTVAPLTAIFWILALSLPLTLSALLAAVPERRNLGLRPLTWAPGLRLLAGNGPLGRLLGAVLLNGLANGLPAALFLIFVGQVLGLKSQAALLLAVYFAAAIFAVPLWVEASRRFGKHRAWSGALALAGLALPCVAFLGKGDFLPFLLICGVTGTALAADLALPPAALADVIDLDTLRGGEQRGGLIFGLFAAATKLAPVLALGLGFPLLALVGVPIPGGDGGGEGTGEAGAPALVGLAVLYGLLPAVLKFAAVALVWDLGLDARRQAAVRRRLEHRAEPVGDLVEPGEALAGAAPRDER